MPAAKPSKKPSSLSPTKMVQAKELQRMLEEVRKATTVYKNALKGHV